MGKYSDLPITFFFYFFSVGGESCDVAAKCQTADSKQLSLNTIG